MKKLYIQLLGLSVFALSSTMNAQLLTPEVLYYDFNGSGNTVPNLASAPPIGTTTATLMGGLTQGGSAICNGTIIGTGVSSTTDYLNTGWAPNLGTGSWTISIRTENITPSATLFYIFGDVNTTSFRCFTNGVAGANNWILRGGGLTDILINGGATVAPHMNTWVYDATLNQVRAYLDGVLVNTVAQGAPNITGAGPFKVNGYSANVGNPLNGHLDEFRVYSRALTPSEISQLYNPYVPSGFLGADQNLCSASPLVLSLPYPAGSVLWSNGDTTTSTTVSSSQLVTVAVSGACGSGNDTVNIVLNAPTYDTISAASCGSYTAPSGAVYTASGTYNDTLANVAGCDSVITINVNITQPSSSSISPVSCGNYTSPAGNTYTTSGTYNDTLLNTQGCDSVITINLTVNQPTTASISANACDMYTAPSGAMYMNSGTFNDTIANMMGCDSVITINLTITNSTSATVTASACGMYILPDGDTAMTSGTYTSTIPNMAGCDSVITSNVTINTSSTSTMTASACTSFLAPSGAQYTNSGTYLDTIPNMAGCDSVITINLTIIPPSTSSINASACNSYTAPSGAVYTSSGTYMDTIPSLIACDSIITIGLQITTVNAGATASGAVCTATGTTAGATFQWIDCANNSPIAGATALNYTATANGNYAVIMAIGNCSDTSNCVSVTGIGIEENNFATKVNLYPNPNSGAFVIDLGANYEDVSVVITDLAGRTVHAQNANNANLIPVEFDSAAGMYIVTVVSGSNKASFQLIRQ